MTSGKSSSEPSLERRPQELEPHPQAERVPAMRAAEYAGLRADIDQRGLQEPLEITKAGIVLDGRQRWRAALELGLGRVPVRVAAPADELDHMLRAAILRRQLSPSQKAALVLELDQYRQLQGEARTRQRANLKQHASEVATSPPRGKTRELAAGWAGIGARTLQDAATVKEHDPEAFERLKAGELLAAPAARRIRRALRDLALPAPAPPPEGPFGLIYADPPWQLGGADSDRAPENHYPTQSTSEIGALRVPAAEDAVLFLWAVSSLLSEALAVMAAWGFAYRTSLVWVKNKPPGLGAWVRHRHELLLLGRKGSFPAPDPEDRPDSVIDAARGRHSQKPICVYELLERAYPRASKLELFARTARPGWSAWGNQLPPAARGEEETGSE